MDLYERVILTDCDGVILDWNTKFHEWMSRQGYNKTVNGDEVYKIGTRYGIGPELGDKLIREFNNSSWIGSLPAYRDAIYYMDLLYRRHGYQFRVITSLSSDPYSQKLRRENLYDLFGHQMFEDILCLDTGADKDQALEPYRDSGCFWIEDSVKNAQVGRDLGLNTFLMEHTHNRTRCPDRVSKVANWQQIYRAITGQT